MGFFDWLFGKPEQTAPGPPRPKVVSGLDNNSPQVLLDMGNGTLMVMDREQYDYMYGESSAPDPAQRDLDELLPTITRARAIASGMFRGRAMGSEVVLETTDPTALAALRDALRIVEDPRTFSHCSCLGGPTLELYAGQELAATIGLQHGQAIRWARWKHDAQLRHGQVLTDWLARHGIEKEMLAALLGNHYDVGGMLPLGLQRGGPAPLSRAEQRVRLAELGRVRGGDLEAALARCQEALDAEPGLAFGHAIRALIHHQRGDQAQCVADCTEAIRLGFRKVEVYFTRAVARDHLGQPHEALADCTAALEIDPRHVNAWNSRGLIHGRLGLLDRALADLDEAIRLAPDWALPYLNRAQVHARRNDLDAAVADCDRVIDRVGKSSRPDDSALAGMAFWGRGQCYRLKGDEARAEADFREALRRNPNLANVQGGLAE